MSFVCHFHFQFKVEWNKVVCSHYSQVKTCSTISSVAALNSVYALKETHEDLLLTRWCKPGLPAGWAGTPLPPSCSAPAPAAGSRTRKRSQTERWRRSSSSSDPPRAAGCLLPPEKQTLEMPAHFCFSFTALPAVRNELSTSKSSKEEDLLPPKITPLFLFLLPPWAQITPLPDLVLYLLPVSSAEHY